jgi:dihydroneopterin aldolase
VSRDRIEIEGLAVQCVIGVRPEERDREQTVLVDLAIEVALRDAGRSGRIGDTCDYSVVADEVAALLAFRRFKLLENAAEEIAAMVLGLHRGTALELRLRKPGALANARSCGVLVTRTPLDYPRRRESARFGEVEVLLETREAGLYLLHVEPQHMIPRHHHEQMREVEWLVDGELVDAVDPATTIERGVPRVWPHGLVHGYVNPTSTRATLFCCDTPPFLPADEIDEAVA